MKRWPTGHSPSCQEGVWSDTGTDPKLDLWTTSHDLRGARWRTPSKAKFYPNFEELMVLVADLLMRQLDRIESRNTSIPYS